MSSLEPPTFQYGETRDLKMQRTRLHEGVGTELHPESSLWKIYVDEAKDQDTEITTERNKNLDTMLLFATLYSAILTAFLIESTGLLMQDNSETSVALLLNLAQSQWRIETGRADSSASPVEIPLFKPTHAARLINILWFASLIVSLGVVMFAMLAKEWLSEFMTYKTRHAHQYALQRQARFDSLKSWGMLPIIDFLPTLVHFSFFLFLLGLIIRLWILDLVVAYVITGTSGVVILLYVGFVFVGAAVGNCPYKAKLSGYIEPVFSWFRGKQSGSRSSTKEVPNDKHCVELQDINAIQWFLDHGRDPVTISLACQALAGLKNLKPNPRHFSLSQPGAELGEICTQSLEPYSTILALGSRVLEHLEAAPIKAYNESVDYIGASVVRYAIALSHIYPYALTWIQQSHLFETDENVDLYEKMNDNASYIIGSVFHALDSVWENETPFTTESYAYLTLAELELIGHALSYVGPGTQLPGEKISQDHIAISISPFLGRAQRHPSSNLLSDLQERYSRALGRAALLIQDITVSKELPAASLTRIIHDTLSTILQLAARTELHSERGFDLYAHLGGINIPVATNSDAALSRMISNQQRMRSGVLSSVMMLWGPSAEGLQRSTRSEIDKVAQQLMTTLGPGLTSLWAKGETWPRFNQISNIASALQYGAQPIQSDREETEAEMDLLIHHLLEITHFALNFIESPDMHQLAEVALDSLGYKANTDDGGRILYDKLVLNYSRLSEWLSSLESLSTAQPSSNFLNVSATRMRAQCAKLLSLEDSKGSTICSALLNQSAPNESPPVIISIMKLISSPQSLATDAQRLLKNIVDFVKEHEDPEILEAFTQGEGLQCLLDIGANHPQLAAQSIIEILVHLDHSRVWVRRAVLYRFLKATRLACDSPPQNWNHACNFFIPSAVQHLRRLEDPLKEAAGSNTIHTIDNTLRRLREEAEHMTNQREKHEAMSDLDDISLQVQEGLSKNPRDSRSAARRTPSPVQIHVRRRSPSPVINYRRRRSPEFHPSTRDWERAELSDYPGYRRAARRSSSPVIVRVGRGPPSPVPLAPSTVAWKRVESAPSITRHVVIRGDHSTIPEETVSNNSASTGRRGSRELREPSLRGGSIRSVEAGEQGVESEDEYSSARASESEGGQPTRNESANRASPPRRRRSPTNTTE